MTHQILVVGWSHKQYKRRIYDAVWGVVHFLERKFLIFQMVYLLVSVTQWNRHINAIFVSASNGPSFDISVNVHKTWPITGHIFTTFSKVCGMPFSVFLSTSSSSAPLNIILHFHRRLVAYTFKLRQHHYQTPINLKCYKMKTVVVIWHFSQKTLPSGIQRHEETHGENVWKWRKKVHHHHIRPSSNNH